MPKLHSRESLVSSARLDLATRVLDWQKAHGGLTTAETLQTLSSVLSDELGAILKYEIRYERHENYDTPGGWE